MKDSRPKVVVLKDGPYEVHGDVPLSRHTIVSSAEGESLEAARDAGDDP